jgi:prevent-host-death family protein
MDELFNLHEAKTHLSRLVDQAVGGHDIVIAKAGKPMVRLVPVEGARDARELGFLRGRGDVDGDIKRDFEREIEAMFAPYLPPRSTRKSRSHDGKRQPVKKASTRRRI